MRSLAFLAVTMLCVSFTAADSVGTAEMTNANEVAADPVIPTLFTGGARPASFGTMTVTLNDAQTQAIYLATVHNIDFTGDQTADINDNLTAAHLHGPATPSTNAGVVFGFFGSPFNDNSPNDVVVTPFAEGVGGTISGKWDLEEGNGTTLALQIDNFLASSLYANFHTVQYPAGEIRGMVVVPEPATGALLALIAAALLPRRQPTAR